MASSDADFEKMVKDFTVQPTVAAGDEEFVGVKHQGTTDMSFKDIKDAGARMIQKVLGGGGSSEDSAKLDGIVDSIDKQGDHSKRKKWIGIAAGSLLAVGGAALIAVVVRKFVQERGSNKSVNDIIREILHMKKKETTPGSAEADALDRLATQIDEDPENPQVQSELQKVLLSS